MPKLLVLCLLGSVLGSACPGEAQEPGSLVVRSVPSGADVLLDGQPEGRTPLTVAPSALVGDRDRSLTLALSHPDFRSWQRKFVIHGRSAQTVTVHLQPRGERTSTGEFEVEEEMLIVKAPAGWDVSVDGRAATASSTGHALLVAAGTHSLELSGEGEVRHNYRVTVGGGGAAEVKIAEPGAEAEGNAAVSKAEYLGCEGCEVAKPRKPRAAPGRPSKGVYTPREDATADLAINTRPPAAVFVDGQKTGRQTPIWPAEPLRLTPGAHELGFVTSDGERFNYRIWVSAERMSNKLIIKKLGERHSGNVRGEFVGAQR